MCRTLALVRTVLCSKLRRSSLELTEFVVSHLISALAEVSDSEVGQDFALQQAPAILIRVDGVFGFLCNFIFGS